MNYTDAWCDTTVSTAAIKAGIGALAVYMLAEGMTDKARAAQNKL
jgi:hypothetical protein